MADQKPTNRERVKEIVDGIEQNIQELFQSEKYLDYLRTMPRFHSYSVNNTILIHMQRPNAATPVAGFQKWKQFGRHVKKGEKGLTIIAPTPLKKKIEEMKLDPDTKAPVLDQDGNAIYEEKTIEIPLFKPVKVFSADQTEGKPLPSLVTDLTGNVQQYEAFMEALRLTSPVPVKIEPIEDSMDGFFSRTTQSITVRDGMSEVQTVCATVHEIAHAVLHNREQDRLTSAAGNTDKEPPKAKDKNTMEVEAESVSFAVCQYYGIDTSDNSLGYIAGWSKDRSLPELKASLETITKTVSGLISSIDKHFVEICKQRGIDLTAQQEPPTLEGPDSPERFVSDFFTHLNELYEAGLDSDPFSSGKREDIESIFLGYMQKGDFSSFRHILDDVGEKSNLPTTAALRDRLENLSDQWDAALVCKIEPYLGPGSGYERSVVRAYENQDGQHIPREVVFVGTGTECRGVLAGLESGALTLRQVRQSDFEVPAALEPKYIYKMDANPRTVGADDQHYIQAYEKTEKETLIPGPVLFVGKADVCQGLLEQLNSGTLQPGDFFTVSAARVSDYTTKDGAELDAFVGPDDKVYLGRRDHYDNRGHYFNHDESLIHVSDNEKVFNTISGNSKPYTQSELWETGYFTQEEFERFSALQLNMPEPEKETAALPEVPEQEDEALYLAGGSTYIHIQTSEDDRNYTRDGCYTTYDYTLYDKETMRQLDGGRMEYFDMWDDPQQNLHAAAVNILTATTDLGGANLEAVSLDVLETLQDAAMRDMEASVENVQPEKPRDYTQELRDHFAQEDAALWDTTLDEYPMPDPLCTMEDLENNWGYLDGDLLPLTKDRAVELVEQDLTIYAIVDGGQAEMLFDADDLAERPMDGMFAVAREEWEASPDFRQAVADRMDHQEDRERAFLDHGVDCFAIYQVKDDAALRDIRFESMDWLKSKGQTVERGNYDLVYTAPLSATASVDAALDQLWYQFNNEHPADYQHPSMSVSDIIAIKRDGVVSCHYCDSFGFQQLLDFIKPENYLKNAEVTVEDDYGMIDGIINNGSKATVAELEAQVKAGQQISLTDLAEATHRERGEKKSVLAKLNAKPPQQKHKKSAPKKSAGKER